MDDRSSYTKAEAKIHILYLVNKVPGVSYHMLMDACMKSLLMDFFDFTDAYEELIAGNLMNKNSSDKGTADALGSTEILTVTDGGKAVLADLVDSINDKVLTLLDKTGDDLRTDYEQNSKVTASKTPVASPGGSKIMVDLGYNDGSESISLSILADSDADADSIIRKWRSDSGIVLTNIKDLLR